MIQKIKYDKKIQIKKGAHFEKTAHIRYDRLQQSKWANTARMNERISW